MAIWGDFQGLTGVTGGGRGVKKLENWGDIIYGWSLMNLIRKTKIFVQLSYVEKARTNEKKY